MIKTQINLEICLVNVDQYILTFNCLCVTKRPVAMDWHELEQSTA